MSDLFAGDAPVLAQGIRQQTQVLIHEAMSEIKVRRRFEDQHWSSLLSPESEAFGVNEIPTAADSDAEEQSRRLTRCEFFI